jgi:hypothetical protein
VAREAADDRARADVTSSGCSPCKKIAKEICILNRQVSGRAGVTRTCPSFSVVASFNAVEVFTTHTKGHAMNIAK